jgi:hypothetical protein
MSPRSTANAIGVALTVLLLAVAPLGCSDCDLEIVTNTLPDGTVGVPYSFQVVSDCGGDFWFVSQGNLPPGIGLLDNGILRGTATDAGRSTFTLGVIDSDNGDSTFKGFSLTIIPAS